jgi:chromosomal replication initiator protein
LKSPKEIWEAVLGQLQVQVTKPNFETWLKGTQGERYRDEIFVISAPNAFVAEWLESRLQSLIKKTLTSVIGNPVEIKFIVKLPSESNTQLAANPSPADGGVSTKAKGAFTTTNLNPKYTFNTFITGESNRMAYAAAIEVAENPGTVYNPLYIYSDTGLGKTHLLLSIGYTAKTAGRRVLYTSAEQLTTAFVVSLKNNTTEAFHAKYRGIDVLLVDDFQFLSGKVQTQECFYHIFNDLHEENCQIVVTCDCPPKAICSLEKRLMSRMEGGLIADIKAPDSETRLAILKAKAKQLKTVVSPEVLQLIASQFRQNVRELEGSLNRVVTYAKLSGQELDIKTATKALVDLVAKDSRKDSSISSEKIIDTIASYYELSPEALSGQRRDRKTVLARQLAMYLLREQNHSPLSEIGKILGGRDHTTILHGCEKIAAEINLNPQLCKSINELRQSLGIKKKS